MPGAEQAEERCRVVLVGMMGSGKSTIGRLLAGRTGWPYHDNDELLQRIGGRTARQLLAEGGQALLRAQEALAMELGMSQEPPCIVGTAAGTILDMRHRALLRAGIVVWLRAAPETLAERAAGAAHRPWLSGDAAAWMTAAAAERHPLYESVADFTHDTDGVAPEQTAADIHRWLAGHAACGDWLSRSMDASGA